MRTPVTVGVVCGDHGRGDTLARVFDQLPQASLRWVCDKVPRAVSVGYGPNTSWTKDFDELLQDEELDAIVFASPELAAKGRALGALGADKHVFVDGPLATSAAECDELVGVALERNRRLMSYSPALLRPAVRRLRRLIDRGALGEIYYLHARRYVVRSENRGDLLRDTGAELITLVLDLLADEPVEVVADAESYLGRDGPDVIFAKLGFATGIGVFLHLSCLEGEPGETISIVGSEATAVLDASLADRELSLVVTGPAQDSLDELALEPGAKIGFRLPAEDTLRLGCGRFLTSIRSNGEPPCGRETSAVLAVVEALEVSYRHAGSTEAIAPRSPAPPENVVALRGRQ